LPRVVLDLALVEEFRSLLDSGKARNRADLARRYGLTRARVTQLMSMLKLHPEIVAYVKSLPPGTPTRMITERRLRRLTADAPEEQFSMAMQVLPGFAAFQTLPRSKAS
jgi:hypothetical protein